MPVQNDFAPHGAGQENSDQWVLVVDDEAMLRRFAVRILEDDGFRVHQATDGKEAFDLLVAGTLSVDVIVSDIVMPRMNGVELMMALSSSRPELPIVLMSGYGYPELSAQGIQPPCSVIPKPFAPDLLLAEVRRCAKRPGSTTAPHN
jgi:two-component system, cell cycle sensor histidine kinase and response regulator CckA